MVTARAIALGKRAEARAALDRALAIATSAHVPDALLADAHVVQQRLAGP